MTPRYFIEFTSADDAIAGAKELARLGYTRLEAFTPYVIPELDRAIGLRRPTIPRFVFLAGATGMAVAYAILSWTASVDSPLMVGGRPMNSLPAHIPIMFETTVLFAGVTSFVLALVLSKLPALYHPVFEVDGFERTTIDRYWIGIDESDAAFVPDVGEALEAQGAIGVRRAPSLASSSSSSSSSGHAT
jgi:hypothetical protein